MKLEDVMQGDLALFGELTHPDTVKKIENLHTDSRMVKPGDWFLALVGENHDAHEFIPSAVQSGAGGVIYEPKRVADDYSGLLVGSVNQFLADFASWYREKNGVITVGITGSNGKTSLKELIAFLLSKILSSTSVLATEGNFNNHFGVPFTLLRSSARHSIGVIEMGMNHRHEISFLSKIAKPRWSCISSVSTAHIENLGSIEAIAEEKSDILAYAEPDGCLFIPKNIACKEIIERKAKDLNIQIFYSDMNSRFSNIRMLSNETLFQYDGNEYQLPWPGIHQLQNLALAVACVEKICQESGIDEKNIFNALLHLHSLKSVSGRTSRVQHSKYTIYDDSYNANEGSVKCAIDLLSTNASNGKSFFVLGEIAELGQHSLSIHEKISQYAAEKKIDYFIFCGNSEFYTEMRKHWQKYKERGIFFESLSDEGLEKAAAYLNENISASDCILVKGSRSSKMERFLNYIK
jgi:UDP-N-acetylmuramoyl-tripeptide--D-alanyl-D-alanine ligase